MTFNVKKNIFKASKVDGITLLEELGKQSTLDDDISTVHLYCCEFKKPSHVQSFLLHLQSRMIIKTLVVENMDGSSFQLLVKGICQSSSLQLDVELICRRPIYTMGMMKFAWQLPQLTRLKLVDAFGMDPKLLDTVLKVLRESITLRQVQIRGMFRGSVLVELAVALASGMHYDTPILEIQDEMDHQQQYREEIIQRLTNRDIGWYPIHLKVGGETYNLLQ